MEGIETIFRIEKNKKKTITRKKLDDRIIG
jgi:hypothetical protein